MITALRDYVESEILPRYDAFTDGHGRSHVDMVIRESLYLAEKHGADVNMCYVIAAYHDLGIPHGRKTHHLTSGAILAADMRLREWFDEEQLCVMKAAIEDHRASADDCPRTLYGCIVADADHFVEPEDIIKRTVLYGKAHYPDAKDDEQILRAREHLLEKYCEGGYMHYHLNDPRSIEGLEKLRSLAENHAWFESVCRKYLTK